MNAITVVTIVVLTLGIIISVSKVTLYTNPKDKNALSGWLAATFFALAALLLLLS